MFAEKIDSKQSARKSRFRIALLLTMGLIFLTTACGAAAPNPGAIDANASYKVRPLDEVSASGPPQIVDPSDREATLTFESTIPLACSVIYGETTEYGLISVDADMGGGAHADHQPVLAGLEADTEYHYRLQGTAPDGTLYISDDLTFRTPPVEENDEANLASLEAGAYVIASSSNFGSAAHDEQWGANSAIDENRSTAWASNGDGDDAFIEIMFAQSARLYAIEVWTRSMSDGTAKIISFTLTTDKGEELGPFTLETATQVNRFEVDVLAHSLRLEVVDSSGGNTGLIQFAVYGTPIEG